MNADRNGTLPAPHQHVEISVTAWTATRFVVDYIGRPRELVAAGLVTPSMEAKIANQRAGIQLDDNGRRFRLGPISHDAPKRLLWESILPIKLQYYRVSRHAVLKLPGVSALYPEGLPTQEERDAAIRENPGPGDRVAGGLSIQAWIYAESVGGVVSRCRAVGRHQRLMRWEIVDNTLIVPDWSWMVAKRLAGRAS